jgi:hypothetical protein
VGSRVYPKREFKTTVSYAAAIAEDLQKVVTQVVPLSQSETPFDLTTDPEVATAKVLVDCTG